jgi:uncharacterized protein (TIGR03118 family)
MKAALNRSCFLILAVCAGLSPATLANHDQGQGDNPGYTQINLVADEAGEASRRDERLVNAWGILAGRTSVWVNNAETGLTTVYGPGGQLSDFAITVPGPNGDQGEPTGLILNNTRGFVVSKGSRQAPSTFIMVTENGTINAWNDKISGTNAPVMADRSAFEAVYKGAAIARDTNGVHHLYAANFHQGVVDIFNDQFQYVSSFTDSNLPPNFAPFNIRNIRGRLFVTIALQLLPDAEDDLPGPGNGYIDIFDTEGNLLRRFASEGALNSPWGLAVAPVRFGKFSRALLVGNFGDGKINAYDLLTGKWLGALADNNGNDLEIQGLWGLTFEREEPPNHECDFFAERLYFTAGPDGEEHGLMGYLKPINPWFMPAR